MIESETVVPEPAATANAPNLSKLLYHRLNELFDADPLM
jgi:hypothetical protein